MQRDQSVRLLRFLPLVSGQHSPPDNPSHRVKSHRSGRVSLADDEITNKMHHIVYDNYHIEL